MPGTPFGEPLGVGAGLEVELQRPVPLPTDLRAWVERHLGTGGAPWIVRERDDAAVEDGWPVTFIVSDELDASTGEPVARRVHAFYRFYLQAAVARLRSTDIAKLDAALAAVKERLRQVAPPAMGAQVCVLGDLWSGFTNEEGVTT
jgi:hypothetical protein